MLTAISPAHGKDLRQGVKLTLLLLVTRGESTFILLHSTCFFVSCESACHFCKGVLLGAIHGVTVLRSRFVGDVCFNLVGAELFSGVLSLGVPLSW